MGVRGGDGAAVRNADDGGGSMVAEIGATDRNVGGPVRPVVGADAATGGTARAVRGPPCARRRPAALPGPGAGVGPRRRGARGGLRDPAALRVGPRADVPRPHPARPAALGRRDRRPPRLRGPVPRDRPGGVPQPRRRGAAVLHRHHRRLLRAQGRPLPRPHRRVPPAGLRHHPARAAAAADLALPAAARRARHAPGARRRAVGHRQRPARPVRPRTVARPAPGRRLRDRRPARPAPGPPRCG